MQLNPLGPNMTEVSFGRFRVLFSYKTPVAAYVNGRGYVRTSKRWSNTTSRHINKWLDGAEADSVEQKFLDNLTQERI